MEKIKCSELRSEEICVALADRKEKRCGEEMIEMKKNYFSR